MQFVVVKPTVSVSCTVKLEESELRALDALAGYGTANFLEVFYEHLGEAYMRPHEGGIRSLFQKIKDNVPDVLRGVDEARNAYAEAQGKLNNKGDYSEKETV